LQASFLAERAFDCIGTGGKGIRRRLGGLSAYQRVIGVRSRSEMPGSEKSTPVLEVVGLKTGIRQEEAGVHGVDCVGLQIHAGQTLGLVGESGCGKSMTALSIMRLLPPRGAVVAGSIRLEGIELTALTEKAMQHVRGNQVAMVFQDPLTSLNPT